MTASHDTIIAAIIDAAPALLIDGRVVLSTDVRPQWAAVGGLATQDQLDVASAELAGLRACAREWSWSEVETALDRAYAAIGGSNPGSGYDYHCGTHPAQMSD